MGFMFDKKVEEYLENCLPKFCKEDLIGVLEDEGIPGTDTNIRLFMEINSDMKAFREAMTSEWFERMGSIVWKDYHVYDKDEFPGKWQMDNIKFEVVPFGYGKVNSYNLIVDDYLFRTNITSEEITKYKEAMSYGRTVRRLS